MEVTTFTLCTLLGCIPTLIMFIYGLMNITEANEQTSAVVYANPLCNTHRICNLRISYNVNSANYTSFLVCPTGCSRYAHGDTTQNICFNIKDPLRVTNADNCYQGNYKQGVIFVSVSSVFVIIIFGGLIYAFVKKIRFRNVRRHTPSPMCSIPKESECTDHQITIQMNQLQHIVVGKPDTGAGGVVVVQQPC